MISLALLFIAVYLCSTGKFIFMGGRVANGSRFRLLGIVIFILLVASIKATPRIGGLLTFVPLLIVLLLYFFGKGEEPTGSDAYYRLFPSARDEKGAWLDAVRGLAVGLFILMAIFLLLKILVSFFIH